MPERPTFSDNSRKGPIELEVGAGGGCLDFFLIFLPLPGRQSDIDGNTYEMAVKPANQCLVGVHDICICIHTELGSVPRAKICICFTCKSIIHLVLHVTYISSNFIFNQL